MGEWQVEGTGAWHLPPIPASLGMLGQQRCASAGSSPRLDFLRFFKTPVCVAPPLSPMGQQGAGAGLQSECRIYSLPQENRA